jgi:hypothetical protein
MRRTHPFVLMLGGMATFAMTVALVTLDAAPDVDSELTAVLRRVGFTGTVESTLERRLGRPPRPRAR